MLSRVSIQGDGYLCIPDDQHRRVFRARNFQPLEISWDAHVVAATPTLLKGFTIYSGVDFRPTHGIAWYQPRMFEQKRPTSDAPSGADLLGRRPTGREENSSQRVEFPKEREFRLFGLTEWRRSFPPLFLSAGLWKLADKSFLLFEQQLFDN